MTNLGLKGSDQRVTFSQALQTQKPLWTKMGQAAKFTWNEERIVVLNWNELFFLMEGWTLEQEIGLGQGAS